MDSTLLEDSVDAEIYNCLDMNSPRSFFLFAGAGAGKTRTLVEVTKRFRQCNIDEIRVKGKKVAIITYTNAACDEIKSRLDYDQTFTVSTIHSFSWDLIKDHQQDVKKWLQSSLQMEIRELEDAQLKGRAGSKAADDRPRQIATIRRRLKSLDTIRRFSYNPIGDNATIDSLKHSEVISITSDFLANRPLMQSILVTKYPILLIDESQDTNKGLMEAFLNVQEIHASSFVLGLFGDTMQRIYMDGKDDLEQSVPSTWARPAKTVNYRCPRRIVSLVNRIRADVDQRVQSPKETAVEGFVRLFIADATSQVDKSAFERAACQEMARITGDELWTDFSSGAKTLTLEHHMAAKRGGFSEFFDPLYNVDKLKASLLDGSLSGVSLFADKVLPLIKSHQSNDQFSIARIVRTYSLLLTKERFQSSSSPKEVITTAKAAVDSLCALWNDDEDPLLITILMEVHRSGLFDIPDSLSAIAGRAGKSFKLESEEDADPVIDSWDMALQCRFSQLERYAHYVSDQSSLGTHQGIKGLEFPRVMVILDDDEARGFLFSYGKLFGAKALSQTDERNIRAGKETSIDRTRRLFYVTCSRAEKSLAIVAYTSEPSKVKHHAINEGWFASEEIVNNLSFDRNGGLV